MDPARRGADTSGDAHTSGLVPATSGWGGGCPGSTKPRRRERMLRAGNPGIALLLGPGRNGATRYGDTHLFFCTEGLYFPLLRFLKSECIAVPGTAPAALRLLFPRRRPQPLHRHRGRAAPGGGDGAAPPPACLMPASCLPSACLLPAAARLGWSGPAFPPPPPPQHPSPGLPGGFWWSPALPVPALPERGFARVGYPLLPMCRVNCVIPLESGNRWGAAEQGADLGGGGCPPGLMGLGGDGHRAKARRGSCLLHQPPCTARFAPAPPGCLLSLGATGALSITASSRSIRLRGPEPRSGSWCRGRSQRPRGIPSSLGGLRHTGSEKAMRCLPQPKRFCSHIHKHAAVSN